MPNRHVIVIGAACALLIPSIGTLRASEAQAEPRFFHVFEGERLALELDPTRYAILADDVASRSLPVLETLPIPGWRLIEAPAAARSADGMIGHVATMTQRQNLGFVSPVFIGNDGGPVIVSPTLLVRIDPAIAPEQAEAMIAEQFKGEIIERDWANMAGAYRVEAESRSGVAVLDAANALAETPGVLFAEPDMIFTGHGGLIPNDTFFGNCWGLHNTGQEGGQADFDMDAPEAWDITTGDLSVIVVVLDNGVDATHPDLNQIPGADFTSDPDLEGAPVNPCDSHGTPVAGCISAIINNNNGVAGVAPDCVVASARPFISNQPCDGNWTSSASWTVNALAWAESIGARVSNNSNGYGFTSSSIAGMYSATRTNGMVHFASAGNNSSPSITYPSSLSTVNAVIALNRFGNRAGFSNWGTGSSFSAPGETILSTDRQGSQGYVSGDYVNVNGTSFASPYAAGVAALTLSYNSSFNAFEVEQAMRDGATDLGSVGYDTDFGWGMVNARGSLDRGPGAFDLITPGCAGGFGAPHFDWEVSLLAETYTLEVATDPGFTSVVYSAAGLESTSHFVTPGALDPCITHYARVIASNSFGDTASGTGACEFVLTLAADLNDDGKVDTADLGGLVGGFGGSGPFADLNGDGAVDTADLGLLIGEFGSDCSAK